MFEGYWGSVAIFFCINVLMAFSLYVPMTAGLISLGQGGFMAIGAYTSAVLTKERRTVFDRSRRWRPARRH